MPNNHNIQLPATITTDEIKKRIIELGINEVLVNTLDSPEVEQAAYEKVDWRTLYMNVLNIREGVRDGQKYSRKDVNNLWKLLSLTGQPALMRYAQKSILQNTELEFPDFTLDLQHDSDMIEAMSYAAYTGNVIGLSYFYHSVNQINLFKNPKIQRMLLTSAAASGNPDVLKWLITNLQIDVRALGMVRHILDIAAELGNVEMLRYAYTELKTTQDILIRKEDLLFLVFANGSIPAIEYLHSLGFNYQLKTEAGANVLHMAAAHGRIDAMRLAVQNGIDPTSCDATGLTLLHYAANGGNLLAVKYAIELGAKAELNDKDTRILEYSVGNLNVFRHVASLFNAEEIKHHLNTNKQIILQMMISGMGVEGLKFAVQCGFDIHSVIDKYGRNLLDVAFALKQKPYNKELVQYLLQSGVKPVSNTLNHTLLHSAAVSGDIEMLRQAVKVMREHHQKVELVTQTIDPISPIALALYAEDWKHIISGICDLICEENLDEGTSNLILMYILGNLSGHAERFLNDNRVDLTGHALDTRPNDGYGDDPVNWKPLLLNNFKRILDTLQILEPHFELKYHRSVANENLCIMTLVNKCMATLNRPANDVDLSVQASNLKRQNSIKLFGKTQDAKKEEPAEMVILQSGNVKTAYI